jgi:antitoxin VapB
MMTTLPADAETERLARQLAEATGKPVPTVVREAIAAKAAADGFPVALPPDQSRANLSRDELLARITQITDGFASIPVRDPRTAEEIIGYDELGLPT